MDSITSLGPALRAPAYLPFLLSSLFGLWTYDAMKNWPGGGQWVVVGRASAYETTFTHASHVGTPQACVHRQTPT